MSTSSPGPAGAVHRPPADPGTTLSGLPRIGEVIRDVERYVAQALAILDREVDPASLPAGEHQRSTVEVHRLLAGFHLQRVQQELAAMAAVALPAVGSAVVVPMTRPAPPPGEEPPPGSAAAVASAARESPGAVVAPGAGDNVPAGRPHKGPRFLPGPGEDTRRIGGKHRLRMPLPPRWPLSSR